MRKSGMKPMEDRNLGVKMFGMERSRGDRLYSNLQGSQYPPPMAEGCSPAALFQLGSASSSENK